MIKNPPTWDSYLFIKKQRALKKIHIYKMAINMFVDKTTAFYLIILLGYLFASLFIFGDVLQEYQDEFYFIEEQANDNLYLIVSILPLRYMIQSFRHAGVLFSTSEFELSLLPFSRKKIWLYVLLEKLLKKLLIFLLLGLVTILLTPIDDSIVFLSLLLFFIIDSLMTIPQWELFQQKFMIKLLCVFMMIALNGLGVLTETVELIGIVILIGLGLLNILFIPSLLQHVNWNKVTESSDYLIWNMPLISFASQTRFKRQRKFSIFQNLNFRKKAFPYTFKAIHNRLWHAYFTKNMEHVIKIIGTLVILLIFTPFIQFKIVTYIGIAVAIYVYTSIVASFFIDRFQTDIVAVLPWDLQKYKRTFFNWVIIGSLPIVLTILLYFMRNFTWWVPMQILLIICIFLYLFHLHINRAISILEKQKVVFQVELGLALLFSCLIIGSGIYPVLSLGWLFIIPFYKKISK